MKKFAVIFLILVTVSFFSRDFYLVAKLIMYFGFFSSIIWLGKFLSRDFSDGRDNDYFGE
jgi:hypothetical protein